MEMTYGLTGPYDNKRFPHTCTIIRAGKYDPMGDEGVKNVIYEGNCRCYAPHDTTIGGEYDTNYRALSVPEKLTDWKEGSMPQPYDEVVVDFGPYQENMHIVERKPGNLGTHFYCRKDEREY